MNGNEIREKINNNNEKIWKLLDTFMLTGEIKQLMNDNDELRKQCKHEYIDGVCKYCDGFEGTVYD